MGSDVLSETPVLAFSLVAPISPLGIPTEVNDDYTILLGNAVSGGSGTADYLNRMLAFAALADYLSTAGDGAFIVEDGPDGAMQASASGDAGTSMTVGVALHDKHVETDFNGVPVRGVAPVRLATSDPLGWSSTPSSASPWPRSRPAWPWGKHWSRRCSRRFWAG